MTVLCLYEDLKWFQMSLKAVLEFSPAFPRLKYTLVSTLGIKKAQIVAIANTVEKTRLKIN